LRSLRTYAPLKNGLLLCLLERALDVELHKADKTCRIHWSRNAYDIFQNKIRDDDVIDIDRLIVLFYRRIELHLQTYRTTFTISNTLQKQDKIFASTGKERRLKTHCTISSHASEGFLRFCSTEF
jgi:hypothetical protein